MEKAADNLGDESLVIEMLEQFEDTSLDPNCSKLHKAAHDLDYKTIEFVTHTLKGTTATVGGERYAAIALRINRYLKQKEIVYDDNLLLKWYGDLLVEFKALKNKLAELLQKQVDLTTADQYISDYQGWISDRANAQEEQKKAAEQKIAQEKADAEAKEKAEAEAKEQAKLQAEKEE